MIINNEQVTAHQVKQTHKLASIALCSAASLKIIVSASQPPFTMFDGQPTDVVLAFQDANTRLIDNWHLLQLFGIGHDQDKRKINAER